MSDRYFQWDKNKALINEKKHKITFEEAKTVFYDLFAVYLDDPEHSLDEERFIVLGESEDDNILMVCHCMRENDTIVRIISARKATAKERRIYINQ